MSLKNIKFYWKAWALKQDEGDPFSFLEPGEEDKDDGDQDQYQREDDDEEEEEEQTHNQSSTRPPIPPTLDFSTDRGIPLPCECDSPAARTVCLQQLTQKWGNGKGFNILVGLVDALEVSSILTIWFQVYLILFQDTDIPSGFQNSRWPFIKWSWDTIHLPKETHENRRLLDSFLEWSTQKVLGLSKQRSLNKNLLQELLLGVGLYIRDLQLACFTDHEEISIPDYLANTNMATNDVDPINRILQLITDAINHSSGYVFYKTGLYK